MFDGKHVVITGGSSGAGKALAAALLERGARMTLIARNADKLAAARQELAGAADAGRIDIESCDVADAEAVERSFGEIAARVGPADVLVNSAGILSEGPFESLPLERYRAIMDINFFGVLHCSRAVLPQLEAQGGGRIVHIASMAGLMGVYGYAAYCAAKHALVGLAETMRIELAPRGIRVHLVCPPEFESPMVDELETYRSAENRALVTTLGVMPIEPVVRETLRGIERNRFMIVTGRNARAAARLARIFPETSRSFMDRALSRARR